MQCRVKKNFALPNLKKHKMCMMQFRAGALSMKRSVFKLLNYFHPVLPKIPFLDFLITQAYLTHNYRGLSMA